MSRVWLFAVLALAATFASGQEDECESEIVMLESDDSVMKTLGGGPSPKMGKLVNGGQVWQDISTSKWHNVPKHLEGCDTMVGNHKCKKGQKCQMKCKGKKCRCYFYVFLYRCPPCEYQDGRFYQILLEAGWEPFKCTPQFELLENGPTYGTIGFRKKAEAGEVLDIPFEGDWTEWLVFAMQCNPVECEKFEHKGQCLAEKNKGECEWDYDDEKCIAAKCSGGFTTGPNFGSCADHCIDYEG